MARAATFLALLFGTFLCDVAFATYAPKEPKPDPWFGIQLHNGRPPSQKTLIKNKKTVLALYDLAVNKGEPRKAAAKYMGAKYIEHNPMVKDGKDGFIEAVEGWRKASPDISVTPKRIFAEMDHVIVHARLYSKARGEVAAIDIFRLDDNGKIVEHWDVSQPVPKTSANSNGMF